MHLALRNAACKGTSGKEVSMRPGLLLLVCALGVCSPYVKDEPSAGAGTTADRSACCRPITRTSTPATGRRSCQTASWRRCDSGAAYCQKQHERRHRACSDYGDAEVLALEASGNPSVDVVEYHGHLAAIALELALVGLGRCRVHRIRGVADDQVGGGLRLVREHVDRRAGAKADDENDERQKKKPRALVHARGSFIPGSRPRYAAGLPSLGLPPRLAGGSSVRVLPAGGALVVSHGITS